MKLHRTGTVHVDLPPERAYRYFTPVGERDWVDGWDPVFPDGEVGLGDAAGTVFTTAAHGTDIIWVVVENDAPRAVRYARVTPGSRAGIVSIALAPAEGGSAVSVTYELTGLSADGDAELEEFALEFDDMLLEWQTGIAAAVHQSRSITPE